MVEMPLGGLAEEERFGVGILRSKPEAEKVTEQTVKPVALPSCIEGNQKHRIAFQLFEYLLRPWLAGETTDQIGTHHVQHRDSEEQTATIVRLRLQHFFAEVVGDQSISAAEVGDEFPRII